MPIRTICGSAIDHTVDVAVDNGLYYRAHIGAVTYYLLRFSAPLTGFRGFCRKAGLLSNFFLERRIDARAYEFPLLPLLSLCVAARRPLPLLSIFLPLTAFCALSNILLLRALAYTRV